MPHFYGPWHGPLQIGIVGHLVSVVTFLLALVFIGILLRSRRTPASTIAWLFTIAIAPYIGIPLFLMFGWRKFGKSRHAKTPIYKRGPGARDSGPSRLRRVLRSVGVPEPAENSRVEFLAKGELAYGRLLEAIRGAEKSISLATFIFARDEVGRALLEELTEKVRKGVQVRLLLDAWGSSILVRPCFKKFKAAGGKVAYFMPLIHLPFKGITNLRNHRKLAVFDGRAAWMGGMNLAHEYLGPTEDEQRWIDLAVYLEGPSAGHLEDVFVSDWAFASGEKAGPAREPGASSSRESHCAQVVASGPDVPGDSLYEALLEACFEAEKRIWIATPYFVPDESLIKALELACRRGVDVRVLVPEKSNHFFADLSRGSYLRQLADAGGKAYRIPHMMHGKLVLIDEEFALVGSANFDLRSLLYNYELGVFLYSADEIKLASNWMNQHFAQSDCGPVQPGLFRELMEGVGRLFAPLL